ncbi:hypothetical protein CPAR01_13329 [Colletotrichum paranaense]|uniref:Uncharacterized protein n=1 Tax=Colletotrichum paranaense TaxID=1914294 RepID=A0ABQ9S5T5_9PEZI|nr:uncharacterized protein CPAR01_13329 [Colletotrichum paranaense]KAK1526801.1 hypothetical protein CPAR01_13329 [Colletotrichum paranaense]
MFWSDTAAKEEDAPPFPLGTIHSPGTTPAHYNRGLSFERVGDGTDGLNFVPHIPSSPCALRLFIMKMSAKSEPPPPLSQRILTVLAALPYHAVHATAPPSTLERPVFLPARLVPWP